MKLHAFGDSFVVGDQDDFYNDPNTSKTNPPTHGMSYNERLEYIKYNVSFVSIIAKHLKLDLINFAERGSGNYPQIDRLLINLLNGKIKAGDLVFFGITTLVRDRLQLIDFKKSYSSDYGPCLIDRELLNQSDMDQICKIDLLCILSILERLSKTYNIKILTFNLFTNILTDMSDEDKLPYNIENNIFLTKEGNTLIDILNDTWGQVTNHPYHDRLEIPSKYEYLYTNKKHPSIEGHKKIASWWINNIQF
jgi:hypothetical protein